MPAETGRMRAVVGIAAGLAEIDGAVTRRWLSRARVHTAAGRREWLPRILEALGLPPPAGGLAALRYQEQTGAPPERWVAAADPVWLEAGMNRLHLHALPAAARAARDVRDVFDRLGTGLGQDGTDGCFVAIGEVGYLLSETPVATAALSPELAQGASPERWLPAPLSAPGYHRLLAEVQMCLHDAEVNRRRAATGTPPLNALWLWGGGEAAPPAQQALPPLFADDAVLRGYWRSASAPAQPWPGTLPQCLAAARGDFVALAPPGDPGELLEALRRAVTRRALGRLTLLFADGATAELRPGDRFRVWRRAADLSPPAS